MIRSTFCPVQQRNQEAFAGAVIIRLHVTGQNTTGHLMENQTEIENMNEHVEPHEFIWNATGRDRADASDGVPGQGW